MLFCITCVLYQIVPTETSGGFAKGNGDKVAESLPQGDDARPFTSRTITKNAGSGIVNDPNLWSDNPRYILDLVSRVIQMSVETQKVVAGLPKLDFSSQKS